MVVYVKQVDLSGQTPYEALLPVGFLKGADRYKRPEDRLRSLCCRSMLFDHLQKKGIAPADPSICHTRLGKPFLKGAELQFSFAHSHDLCAVMVSEEPCGVDIERVCGEKNTDRLAEMLLSKEELAVYLASTHRQETFISYFTKKEAQGKRQGTGILPRSAAELDVSGVSTMRIRHGKELYALSFTPSADEIVLLGEDLQIKE